MRGKTPPSPIPTQFFLKSLLSGVTSKLSLLQRIGTFDCLYSQTRIVYTSPYCGYMARRYLVLLNVVIEACNKYVVVKAVTNNYREFW